MTDSEGESLLPSKLAQIRIDIINKQFELSLKSGDIVNLKKAEPKAKNKIKKNEIEKKIKEINIEIEKLKEEISRLKEIELTQLEGVPPVPENRRDYKGERPIASSRSRSKPQQSESEPEPEPEPEYVSDEQTTESDYEDYYPSEEEDKKEKEKKENKNEKDKKKKQGSWCCSRPLGKLKTHKKRKRKQKQTKRRKKKKQTRKYKKLK